MLTSSMGARLSTSVLYDYKRLNSGAPEVSQNLNTVLVGEIVVEHEQVESAGGKHLEGCFATHRDRRIVTFVLEARVYNHLLGECGVTFVATAKLARSLKNKFPQSLDGAPMLLPIENTEVRRNLHYWFDSLGIRPQIAGEFQDHALLRAFGQAGIGVFPIPSGFEKQIEQQGSLQRIGRTEEVCNRFYAISVDRKLKHPAVLAICDTARQLFA